MPFKRSNFRQMTLGQDLRWDQIDFTHAVLHVRRAKKGTPATHPVVGDEMRAGR